MGRSAWMPLLLFAGAFAMGWNCSGTFEAGVYGEMTVEPDEVMADGVASARITVRVFNQSDGTPLRGSKVGVFSSRNEGDAQVDEIVGSKEPTDANGEVVAFISSTTEGPRR